MLKIKDVNKKFEEAGNLEVLKNISLDVDDGEFVCILGPSGCGKTVLLFLVAGFFSPTSGKIFFDGRVLEKPSTKRVMIFQDPSLFPWLTVYENIFFGLEKSNLSKKRKRALVSEYLVMTGMNKFKDWYPHLLSGGMKQKVAIARALVSDPRILLMDEPFASLDPQYRKFMRRNLEKIWQTSPKSIIFVTHSVNEAVYLADTVHIFSNLPAKIKKSYRIDLPRPRNPRSEEFMAIAEDIEKNLADEFKDSFEKNLFDKQALNNILKNIIIK